MIKSSIVSINEELYFYDGSSYILCSNRMFDISGEFNETWVDKKLYHDKKICRPCQTVGIGWNENSVDYPIEVKVLTETLKVLD